MRLMVVTLSLLMTAALTIVSLLIIFALIVNALPPAGGNFA